MGEKKAPNQANSHGNRILHFQSINKQMLDSSFCMN